MEAEGLKDLAMEQPTIIIDEKLLFVIKQNCYIRFQLSRCRLEVGIQGVYKPAAVMKAFLEYWKSYALQLLTDFFLGASANGVYANINKCSSCQ
ncbi:hypothetical protein L1987_22817 [Smallanthus sonchifolius]|uniref:Uncharacterized protein n=1 Tax=Smallanthus sonchifolius TaxID=185202 RepID=A0ACB9IG34_9ASTR|nr:hypothetical protein L1987_22817 [Smallanthus sonchifolius]